MKSYGTLELTVSSPPQSFCEPLSLDEVRQFLHITESSPADLEEQAMLEGMVIAAREIAERYQGVDLTVKQYDLYLDSLPSEIDLGYPLQSVDLVQYTNSASVATALTAGTDYVVDTARGLVLPAYGVSWPSFTAYPSGAILVRFTRGYPENHPFWSSSGQRILQGMKLLITMWHEQRIPVGEVPETVVWLFNMGARLMVH